jgi:hypothetical protein
MAIQSRPFKMWVPSLTFGVALALVAYAVARRRRSAWLRGLGSGTKQPRRAPYQLRGVLPVLELELEGIFDGHART